jgi:hypothetical protein
MANLKPVSIWAAMGVTAPAAIAKTQAKADADIHAVKRLEALMEPDADGVALGLVSYTESRYDGKVIPAHERVVFFSANKVESMVDAAQIVTFPPKMKNGQSFAPFAITEERLAKASNAWPTLQARKAAKAKQK